MKKTITYTSVTFLVLFGLLTVFMGSSVIFDWFGIRKIEGNYVLFVVWANLLCGFLYLIAAYGFIKQKKWTVNILLTAVIILLTAFAGLAVHILIGGIYEKKTLGAMTFRTIFTILLIYAAKIAIIKKK